MHLSVTGDANVGPSSVTAQAVNLYNLFAASSQIRFDNTRPYPHTSRRISATRRAHPMLPVPSIAASMAPAPHCNGSTVRSTLATPEAWAGTCSRSTSAHSWRPDAGWPPRLGCMCPRRVPAAVRAGCYVFLHGCLGSVALTGVPSFPLYSGHNEWADTNSIIVLYPQTSPDNPHSGDCWDIGGIYGSDYDQKSGVQMTAIMSMVAKITSGYKAPAIEYFHAEFRHYFITASADEITKLDNGTFTGWTRTGQSFNVGTAGGAGRVPVCRFFTVAFPPTSSHFYAPRGLGCEGTLGNADWQFEGDVFFAALPDAAGACPPNYVPVYRLYNNGQGGAPNHRFTTSRQIQADMLAAGYLAEGAGIGVGMCSPQ